MRDIILAYQNMIAGEVARFDGHVAKYMGDGVLIYFGWPTAHEDEAERAVRCGLSILQATAVMNTPRGEPLAVRIGIATGLVVVGDLVGEGAAQEEAVVGETPNLAARLQSLAKPNTLVISPTTQRLTGNRFECVNLGEHELKGFAEAVQAWAVSRLRDEDALASPGDGTNRLLVGRDQELELLRARWVTAQGGAGQMVLLSGEPGVGKTHLLETLRAEVGRDKVTQIAFRCSSYHTSSALYPMQKHLERVIERTAGDGSAETFAKIERMLGSYEFADEMTAVLFAALLGISPPAGTPPVRLPPEQQKQQIQAALMAWMAEEVKRRPVLMVWEDLHWADPSTVELVGLILDYVPSMPLLVLLTARPEFQSPWGTRSHLTPLTLSRLGTEQVAAIARHVAGGVALPAELMAQIEARTDGVPLYVEEMTKTIVESGMLRRVNGRYELTGQLDDVSIPITLHDSLMARLDRLGNAKSLAQMAAVIGREFAHALLKAVTPSDEAEMEIELRQLIDSELIYPRGLPPQATYWFKHALVQDAAYESLLRRRREALHGAIAEAIETFDVERASEQTVLLAHHYARSAQPEKAIVYALRAGDASVQLHARAEATTHYLQALTIAQGLSDSAEAQRNQIDAIVKLAAVSSSREDSERDADNLQQAQTLAEALADQPRLGQVLYWLGRVHYAHGELAIAADYAEQSLAVADALGDEAMAAPSVNLLGRYYVVQGNVGRGSDMMARSVEQMHQIGDTVEEATAAGFAGFAYAWKGDFAQGFAYADRGLALAQQLENPFAEAAAYHYRGIAHIQHGAWAEGIADFSKGREIAEAVGDGFRSYMLKGYESEAQIASGNLERAQELVDDAVAFAEKIGTKFNLGIAKRNRAAALLALGERDSVLAACQEAIDVADEAAELLTKSRACKLLVDTWYKFDMIDDQEAEQTILEVIRIQQELGAEPELARSYLTYARLLRSQGEMDKAKEYYDRATDRFQRMGMVWDLAQAEQISADWV
jgi:tetratricopeptide (TPR) repeat protein